MLDSIKIEELTVDYLMPWAINIALALVIFVVGRMVANMIVGGVKKLLKRSKVDAMLSNFISSLLKATLLLFVLIAALEQLGVNTTSLIALLGAAGLAVGLALQGSLQNFAAGVMLLIFRPFKLGDFVEAGGTMGSVQKINIFSSVLLTPDNREIIVPNSSIFNGNITNYSSQPNRRVDMVFGIGYGDDMKQAKQIIQGILDADSRVLKDPAPTIVIGELGDSSVNIYVRPWVVGADYWKVKFDLNENIKSAFDENGISIPFPQMDVHLDKLAD
jgi:small conductance mechanosensitive channel